MPKESVFIACRLPNGIILHHPKIRKVDVKLNGVSSSKIIGSTFAITEVDSEFWTAWEAAFGKSALIQSHAIFKVRNEAEATSRANDLRKEWTGFEQVPQVAMGVQKAVS
jgi:hypothetical protein